MEEIALNYKDICLVPRYSELRSRSEADTSIELGGFKFSLPVLMANMPAVINSSLAKQMSENDYFYIMHRFCDNKAFVETANKENWKCISVSIGVKEGDKEFVKWVAENYRIDFLCIDVAHAFSILTKEMLEYINKLNFKHKKPFIIVGNVTTSDAVLAIYKWGANMVKCGIAGGAACQTKNKTGFHIPMFSMALECCKNSPAPIVIDGGIKENGDIAKALVAGMSVCNQPILVMCGSLFAACLDSAAESIC